MLYLNNMRKSTSLLILICGIAFFSCAQVTKKQSVLFPVSKGYVNDYEHIFSDKEKRSLDSLVTAIEKRTQIEIAIVTLDSTLTSLADFDNYTLALAKKWGVGKKDLNNGILIGFSVSLRKIRIQNGLGIEPVLSNEATKEIIDHYLVPNFKNSAYYDGIKSGILELMKKLE